MRLLLVLAGFGAAIGLAAPAQADPNVDFLSASPPPFFPWVPIAAAL
jgi:hypothetical protein